MVTQELKDKGTHCRGQGFNCCSCKDAKECVEYVECENPFKNNKKDREYLILADDYEELLCISEDKSEKKIFIKTYEPHGYIDIQEAKKLIISLQNMIRRIEGDK
jgi:hypothetical protein